jgi:thymidylate kinase
MYRDAPDLAWSSLEVIGVRQQAVLAHVCRGDDWTMLAMHNLGDRHETVKLEIAAEEGAVTLHDRFDLSTMTIEGTLELELEPYGWRWLQVAPAGAIIRRV